MKLATLCYVRDGMRTLMLHRVKKPNDMHAGKWNGLGGKVEPGESPEECAIREVFEESGLRVAAPDFQGILTFPEFSRGEDWYVFVFVMREFTGTVIESTEGRLAWVENDRLLELNLWSGDRIFMGWLETGRHFSGKFVYRDGELVDYEVAFYTANGGRARSRGHIENSIGGSGSLGSGLDIRASALSRQEFERVYRVEDDVYCWLCNGPMIKRHCKIICSVCGFTRLS